MKRKEDVRNRINRYHQKYPKNAEERYKHAIRVKTWRMVKLLEIEKKYECEICGR